MCVCMPPPPPPPSPQGKVADSGSERVLAEFARIEEQLNGVERYAMNFLEAENAEFAAEQLRIAEVSESLL